MCNAKMPTLNIAEEFVSRLHYYECGAASKKITISAEEYNVCGFSYTELYR